MATTKYILSKVGERPSVTMRLTIDNQRKVQAKIPGLLAYRALWSEAKQTHNTRRANPVDLPEVNELNRVLSELSAHVIHALASGPNATRQWLTDTIAEYFHPRNVSNDITLADAYAMFVDDAPKRIIPKKGRPVTSGTIRHYTQTQNILTDFLAASKQRHILVNRIDKTFYDELVSYMYKRGLQPNTIGGHIKNIKAAINLLPIQQRAECVFIQRGKCLKLMEDSENIYLTEEEIERIQSCEMTNPYLSLVRDEFVLLAWTGCRYSDLNKLSKENIVTLDGGMQYFRIQQQKTGTKVTIPILPMAKAVLEKYDYKMRKPISNQKFNNYIKDVCKEAGLTDPVVLHKTDPNTHQRVATHFLKYECVTAHTARRSFATNMYKRNFPTLMIMAITGHKTEKAFLTYIKVTEDENAQRMMAQFMAQQQQDARQSEHQSPATSHQHPS